MFICIVCVKYRFEIIKNSQIDELLDSRADIDDLVITLRLYNEHKGIQKIINPFASTFLASGHFRFLVIGLHKPVKIFYSRRELYFQVERMLNKSSETKADQPYI